MAGGTEMAEKLYNQGDIVFKKGDYGDTFFKIIEGAVQIVLLGKRSGYFVHSAIDRDVGYHVRFIAVEIHHTSNFVREPAT